MSSMLRTLSLPALAAALVGCATATGPEFRQTELPEVRDSSLLVAYRSTGLASAAYKVKLYLDGVAVFALPTKGYSYARISAGNHTICDSNQKSKIGKRCVDFLAENGATTYIAFDTGNMGYLFPSLKTRTREEALDFLMHGYRYEPPLTQAQPSPSAGG